MKGAGGEWETLIIMGSYKVRGVLENFLSSGIRDGEDTGFLRRIRVLNITGLTLVVFASIWSISFLSHRVWAVGATILAMVMAEVAVLVLLRRFRRPALFSNITIGLLLMGISLSNWFTGGLSGANVTPFFIVPVIAIALMGRWGLVWALTTFLVMAGFGMLAFDGYVFPNVIPDTEKELDKALTWATAFFFLAALAYHYESTRSGAERRILEEKDRAEEAARTKSQFLANMSHELRTPLNAIMGLTDLTLRTDLDDDQRKKLQKVKEQAYSLLGMVEDVLDVSRMEAARLEILVAPFDPRALAKDIIGDYMFRADSKGLELRLEMGDGLPDRLRGDAALVKKILGNLLDNAVKFTDTGSITVRVEPGHPSGLTFMVEDTGIGIPPEETGDIFDAFTQVDSSTTRRHDGTGLGLAICRQITEALGGDIVVESRVGGGTRFRVWLPFAVAGLSAEGADGRRILAVEDDEVSRELVEIILRGAGFLVDTAPDGRSAVEAVRSGGYDLVLMDVQMPGMDGLGATRQIRSNERKDQRVPIVAITAYALQEERKRCLEAGMDDFVTKPIEPESLVKTVRRWVG
jgi:signal transduction histidine kinase